jgi:uncharacterized protein YdaU (DUF1376 family)
MARISWVKWYFTDWMLAVRRMSWAARGIYMEALSLQFHGERVGASLEAWQDLFDGITESEYRAVIKHFEVRSDEDGEYVVNRRLEAEMKASKIKSDKARANAKRMHSGRKANALRTQSDRSAIREEEMREDVMRGDENTAEGSSAPRKARAKPTDPIVWTSESSWAGITEADRAAWAIAYPAVDIDRDLVKADQYLRSNPAKAHKRKWRSFITRWFDRTQERGGNRTDLKAAPAKGAAHGFRANRSHIPPDCRPEDEYLFWDGGFPRIPNLYTDNDGNLRHGETRNIICPAKPKLKLTASANRSSVTNAGESHD